MDANRNGNFTSSKIAALMSNPTAAAIKAGAVFGKPALTYIKQKNWERKLARAITTESNARPLTWGKVCERQVFELLGITYKECSQETISHPVIEYWKGSPDGQKFDEGRTVMDIKCPQTLNSFCEMVECKTIEEVRENHDSGEEYYWQLVSNAIITNSKFAELIIFCPMYSQLNEIRALAQNMPADVLHRYYWIANSNDDEVPYLLESGQYNNLNVIRFEVPQEDKDLLTARVLQAGKLLIPVKEMVTA